MPRAADLTGQDFGRWHVLGPGRLAGRHRLWRVQCSCPRQTVAERYASDLRTDSRSCGCLRAEQLAERNRARRGTRPPALPERACDQCGRPYTPRSRRSQYCGDDCRALARWRRIAADPVAKAAHARRINQSQKDATYVWHDACAVCGERFYAPPERVHCSDECLDRAKRSGKYRHRFQRAKAETEAARLTDQLNRRLHRDPADPTGAAPQG